MLHALGMLWTLAQAAVACLCFALDLGVLVFGIVKVTLAVLRG